MLSAIHFPEKRLFCIACLIFCGLLLPKLQAQNYTFASLKGSPVMDTTGWRLEGNAYLGNTAGGNTPNGKDELILTDPINNTSGACFFKTPVNISHCQKWIASYEYRIFDGTAADGIAFCFLANPPFGYQRGGALGLPARPKGLMVLLDPYRNGHCYCRAPSKIELFYGDGSIAYNECPKDTALVPTFCGDANLLRSNNYRRMTIKYDNGNIKVFIDDTLRLSGFYSINFNGYFGFTASTGGNNDRQSIRNFSLKTYKPILSAPNAGPDLVICRNTPTQIGITPPANDPYTYIWAPTTGLSNPLVANPAITLNNPYTFPLTYTYFLTKDTLGGRDSLCAFSDAVTITVAGRTASTPALNLCSGIPQSVNQAKQPHTSYHWYPNDPAISDTAINAPNITLFNTDTLPYTRIWYVTAIDTLHGCIDHDTLKATVYPRLSGRAGPDRTVCAGSTITLGRPEINGYNYAWYPTAQFTTPNVAQPILTFTNNSRFPVVKQFVLGTSVTTLGCQSYDTVYIRVLPKPLASLAPWPTVCSNDTLLLGTKPEPEYNYSWKPGKGLNDSTIANPKLVLSNSGPRPDTLKYYLFAKGPENCQITDSVSVIVKPAPLLHIPAPLTFCPNDTFFLPVSGGNPLQTWHWENRNGLLDTSSAQAKVFLRNTGPDTLRRFFKVTTWLNACPASDSVLVKVIPEPPLALVVPQSVCPLDTFTLSNPLTTGYSFNWKPALGLLDTLSGTPRLFLRNIKPVPDTQHFVLQTTATSNGCHRTDTFAIIVKPMPPANTGHDTSLCTNLNYTLGKEVGRPGYRYAWSPAALLSNSQTARPQFHTFNNSDTVAKFPFVLNIYDSLSACHYRSDTVTLSVNPVPRKRAGGIYRVCANDSLILGLDTLPGYTHTWLATGNYILRDTTCPKLPIKLGHSISPDTLFFPVKIESKGCIRLDTAIVFVFPQPVASLPDTILLCRNSSVQIGPTANPNNNYLWLTAYGLSDSTIANPILNFRKPFRTDTVVQYKLKVRNRLSGCAKTLTTHVKIRHLPENLLAGSTFVCESAPTQIGVNARPGYTYTWRPATGLNNSLNSNPVLYLPNPDSASSQKVYYLTVTDTLTHCQKTDSVRIIVGENVPAYAGPNDTVCKGSSHQLGRPESRHNRGMYSYTWSPKPGLSDSNIPNPILRTDTLSPGNHTWYLQVDGLNCSKRDSVTINIRPKPVTSLPTSFNVCGSQPTAIPNTALSGYRYTWLQSYGLSDIHAAGPVLTLNNFSNRDSVFQYHLQTVNPKGCLRTDTVRIILHPNLPSAAYSATVCNRQVSAIGNPALPGYSYHWEPATAFANPGLARQNVNPQIVNNLPGQLKYTVTITNNQTLCQRTDSVLILVSPEPALQPMPALTACPATPLQIGQVPVTGQVYSWTPNIYLDNPNVSGPNFTFPADTAIRQWYVLTTSLNGCTKSESLLVQVNPRPALPVISGRSVICPGTNGMVYRVSNALSGLNYTWKLSSLNGNPGTIISAQGPDSVLVNFNSHPDTSILISVYASDFRGCHSPNSLKKLRIQAQGKPEKPQSPYSADTLCLANGQQVVYQTISAPGSRFKWFVSLNGVITTPDSGSQIKVNWLGGNVGKVWVYETIKTPTSTCSGYSDTLFVNLLPSPALVNALTGNFRPCYGSRQVYRLKYTTQGAGYQWQVNGGTYISGSDSIAVIWGSTGGNAKITVTELIGNCSSRTDSVFGIYPIPNPVIATSDSIICPDNIQNIFHYRVIGFAGSTFNWSVQGGKVVEGNNGALIGVKWDTGTGTKAVQVIEIPEGDCPSSSLYFPLYYLKPKPEIVAVSALPPYSAGLLIKYKIYNANRATPAVTISRRALGSTGPWDIVGTTKATDSLFTDPNANTSQNWQYQLSLTDLCNNYLESGTAGNMVLKVAAAYTGNGSSLSWNPYAGWPQGVFRYEIWRSLNGTDSVRLAVNDGNQTNWADSNAADGFEQCYRILAVENGNSQNKAWSNKVCVLFQNLPLVNNIITPNNDNKNDTWVIEKLNLYPDHEVSLSDRYGHEIFRTHNYQNDWDGGNFPAGVYYYSLKVGNGVWKTGWLTLVK